MKPVSLSSFRNFRPDARRLVAVSVLNSVADSTVWFLLTLYLNFLGYSKIDLGTVIFVLSASAVLPLLPAGYISDRFGRRRMVFVGTMVVALGLALFIWASELGHFYIAAAAWGMGRALYQPAYLGFLSEKVGERRRKYLFSFQMFASLVSAAISVLVAGYMPGLLGGHMGLDETAAYRAVFSGAMVFLLLQLVPLSMTDPAKRGEKRRAARGRGGTAPKPRRPAPPLPKGTLVRLCLPMALLGLGAGLIVPFFQVYFQWRFGTSVEDIGLLFAFTQFLWACAYLLMPGISETRGSVRTITAVHSAAIVALVAIPASPGFYFVAAAYVTRMVLMNSAWPIFQSYSLGQMPKEHRSLTLSSTNFAFNGFRAFTPLAAGFLFEMSLDLPFYICAVLYTIATALFFLLFRDKDDVKGKGVVKEGPAERRKRRTKGGTGGI